jgi:fructose-1,6-bisphosphatase/inositol monophosphatase family enzyme
LGEEFDSDEKSSSGFRWFIDPIDGTQNRRKLLPQVLELLEGE